MKKLLLLIPFVAVGAGLPLQWIANVPPRVTTASEIPGIFMDTVSGNNSNAGTSNAPFATWNKVLTTVGSSTTNVYVKRSSLYAGAMRVPTNITLTCYGTGVTAPNIYGGVTNSKPVCTGAMPITRAGITKTGGRTIVYQATLSPQTYFENFPFTNSYASLITSNVLMVWQNGVRVGARWDNNSGAGGIASVDGGAGRFYYDTATKIIYFSTLDASDPTSTGFFEASFDTLCLHGGDNVTVSKIITEKSYAYDSTGGQGYGIFAFGSGTYDQCVARYGWNHNAGVANSYVANPLTFKNCKAGDMELTGGITYVGYKDAVGPSFVTFTNCYAYGYDTAKGTGYYTHDDTSPHTKVRTTVINSVSYFMDAGFSDGYPNSTNWTGNTAVFCGTGFLTIGGGGRVDNFTNYWPAYSGARGIDVDAGATGIINNCKIALTNESFNCFAIKCEGTGTLNLTNTIISKNATASSTATYYIGAVVINSWSNSINNVNYVYRNGEAVPTTGDRNNYFAIAAQMSVDIAGGDETTVAQWKTARSPIDANCTTTDPSYAAGFYTYTIVDPTGGDAN